MFLSRDEIELLTGYKMPSKQIAWLTRNGVRHWVAATDLDDVRAAKDLLGHKSETTTARIYRRLRGERVQPVGAKTDER